jgi:hypothetical protein
MKPTVVVLVISAAALLGLAAAAGEVSVYEFLAGEWEYLVYKTDVRTGELPEELPTTIHYTFDKRNGSTTVLDGSYLLDDTRVEFQVHFLSAFAGEHLVPKEEAAPPKPEGEDTEGETAEETEFVPLFKFNFLNVSAGHYVSQGTYGEHGVYQAIISTGAAPSFTMTIMSKEAGSAEYTTVLAKKILPPKQQTFFQKYGLALMMGAILLMNFSRARGGAQQPAGLAAAARRRPADAPADATGGTAAAAPEPAAAEAAQAETTGSSKKDD